VRSSISARAIFWLLFACVAPLPTTAEGSFFTTDSVGRLAPVVMVHHAEDFLPSSPKNFLDHAGLAFSYDSGCASDYRHRRVVNGHVHRWTPAEISALGDGGFVASLRSSRDSGCSPLPGPENEFSTHDLTRPHQGGRDDRLGDRDGWYLDLARDSRAGLPDLIRGDDRLETMALTYFDDGLLYTNGEPTGSAFVTYWFFYAYDNGFAVQNHEGDWENISIRLEASGPGDWVPVEVYYARHGRSLETLAWDQAAKVDLGGGRRLRVFSARGSHASYPKANRLPSYDDRDELGLTWPTWKRLRFLWSQGWAGYCGAWGSVGHFSDTTGPLGPGCFDAGGHPVKSGRPSSWGESLRTASTAEGTNSIVLRP
jgi:hypothetical protein